MKNTILPVILFLIAYLANTSVLGFSTTPD